MMLVAIVFSFAVAYIAHRGVTGSTAVNVAVNIIQISTGSVLGDGARLSHESSSGSQAFQFDPTSGEACTINLPPPRAS